MAGPPPTTPPRSGLARVRRRRRLRRLALALAGAMLGASCPYWPSDIVWACAVLTRAAEVLHGG